VSAVFFECLSLEDGDRMSVGYVIHYLSSH